MKKYILGLAAIAVLAVPSISTASSKPTAPSPSSESPKIKTFGPGEVQKKSDGSYVIKNVADQSGGVYYSASPHENKLSKLRFMFKTNADVGGGAPRWSIPIDNNSDGLTDTYAFIDAAGCGATVGTNDAGVETVVDTSRSDCKVFYNGVQYKNWNKLYNANPDARLAKDHVAFVVADVPGKYHVYGFVFG